MARVRIYHNISRDAFFGFNTTFRTSETRPEGVERVIEHDGRFSWREEVTTPDERHPLVLVFEYETDLPEADRLLDPPITLLERAFAAFNNGSGQEDPAYFGRRLRSLSVGDVATIDGNAYTCASLGWQPVSTESLRVLTGDAAEHAIRERLQFKPSEPLAVTVPLKSAVRMAVVHIGRGLTVNARVVTAYMPGNYAVTGVYDDRIVIEGQDNAGWTLEDYVIPRLASGLIYAEEVA